jgi:hypothetical protein
MNIVTVLVPIALSVLTTGIVLAVWLIRKREAPKRRPEAGPALPPNDVRLAQGVAWKSQYRQKTKNNPASLIIIAETPFPAPIAFKAESRVDRFGKAIRLASEVQTGDPEFDEAIYVDSPYPDYAAAMLADRDNRRALRRCFAAVSNLSRIDCKTDRASFTISPAESQIPDPALAAELVAALPGLRQSVARIPVRRSAVRERIGVAAILASAAVAVVGLVAMIVGLAAFESLDAAIYPPGLLGGLAGAAAWALLAFLVLRGRSGALVPFLVSVLIGLSAGITMGIGAMHIANGITATAPVESHRVPVTGKHISRSKNSTSYYLEIQPWREGLDTSLRVDSGWYNRYEAGDTIGIDSRMGGLGYEMLLEYHE